jgi:hypothetical protein
MRLLRQIGASLGSGSSRPRNEALDHRATARGASRACKRTQLPSPCVATPANDHLVITRGFRNPSYQRQMLWHSMSALL